jgi:hypothetical protein
MVWLHLLWHVCAVCWMDEILRMIKEDNIGNVLIETGATRQLKTADRNVWGRNLPEDNALMVNHVC